MNKSIEGIIEDIFVKHKWIQRLSKEAVTGEVEIMEVIDELASDIKKQYKVIASGKPKFNDDYGLDWIEIPHNVYKEIKDKKIEIIIREIK